MLIILYNTIKELYMTRSEKIKKIKKEIKKGSYDWSKAVKSAVEKIMSYPQALLWR